MDSFLKGLLIQANLRLDAGSSPALQIVNKLSNGEVVILNLILDPGKY